MKFFVDEMPNYTEDCHYEPQTDWHYDEQDATWYPYKHEDERQTEGVWNAGYKTGYDKGYKDAQKVKDSQDLVKAFCEDGTWLERQGVYTLTLAEAKQRAVDIIESVIAKDEPQQKSCATCKHALGNWDGEREGE